MNDKVNDIIEKARSDGRDLLVEPEAKEVLKEYGIEVPEFEVLTSEEEAVEFAEEHSPIVMKIVSPQVIHKSDSGGVKVNVQGEEEAKEAYNEILDNVKDYDPDANIIGIIAYPMAPEGKEVIIGINKDPQFGPVVMFGLGGIFVEILEDVSFRVAPIDEEEAEEMMQEIKGYPILAGARGEDPVDLDALKEMIVKVSKLANEIPVEELDLNPVFAYKDNAVAVDARLMLEE